MNQGLNLLFEDTIANLQQQLNSLVQQVERLQEKVINLEIQLKTELRFGKNSKYPLRRTLKDLDDTKISQQGNYTLNPKKAAYSLENDLGISSEGGEVSYGVGIESNMLSDTDKRPLKTSEQSEEYNLPSNRNEAQNRPNFITLGNLSEQ